MPQRNQIGISPESNEGPNDDVVAQAMVRLCEATSRLHTLVFRASLWEALLEASLTSDTYLALVTASMC